MSIEEDILIERFLRNELSQTEKERFIERVNSDASFKEKVILEKQLSESLNDNDWTFIEAPEKIKEIKELEEAFKSKEALKIKKAISQAEEAYKKSSITKKRNRFLYSSVAAIALLIILLYNNFSYNNQELYDLYLKKSTLSSLVDRGNSNYLSQAQIHFNNKDFQKVIAALSPIVDTTQNSNIYLYLAVSQIELEKYTEAENTLNQLINSNLLDAQKGHWYKSLLYLKSEQNEKLKSELKTIINNSYYKKEDAKELLEKYYQDLLN